MRKNRSYEERNMIKHLKTQASERNGETTEKQRKSFFWRVIDMKLRKWYRRVEEEVLRWHTRM